MKKTTFLFWSLLMLLFSQNVILGQPAMSEAEKLAERERRAAEIRSKISGGAADSQGMIRHNKEYADISVYAGKNQSGIEKEKVSKFNKLVAPNPEDLIKYESFIKKNRGGLFRLFPDFDCEARFVVKVGEKCANFILGSSKYSFRKKDYIAEFFDIQLKGNLLDSQGFLSQAVFTNLGDVPIEDVTLKTNGMDFLTNFSPQTEFQAVKTQHKQLTDGIKENGYTYSNAVNAENSMTFGLRIIAYQVTVPINYKGDLADDRFAFINFDKRKDLIIAFRIIRKEDDGNITIVWKELLSQKTPKLNYRKNEKLEDFNLKN